jgi:methylphosphotriester-DNA--protein-cysteine methyltransferase
MLVEKGFARRIIRISSEQAEQQTSVNKSSSEEKSETTTSSVYVAAKTSKVFHRPTCPHAKRLDPAKTLTFQTREEAERNGRRPCKTCNP